ncbi:MAG: hypothetical protein LBC71_01810 [Oscillospiraceae bacterium]|jgi:uncharacterized membrane protein|nr:hypothetical protein [Oscillospiraceae bacterium]
MELYLFEIRKMLITHKGWLILLIGLILKTILLYSIPEITDPRLGISHIQYDNLLQQIHGETTHEKERFIVDSFNYYSDIIRSYDQMLTSYLNEDISDQEWRNFIVVYERANIIILALTIFYDKVGEFAILSESPGLSPPHFFYEYGWSTVFNYNRYPDVIFLFIVAVLAVNMFTYDVTSGTISILNSSKNGCRKLFVKKLFVYTGFIIIVAFISGIHEYFIFSGRFQLDDTIPPIYSLTLFHDLAIQLSVLESLILVSAFRVLGLILFGILCVVLANSTKNAVYSLCLALLLMVASFLLVFLSPLTTILFPLGLLMGTQLLYTPYIIGIPAYFTFSVLSFIVFTVTILLITISKEKE